MEEQKISVIVPIYNVAPYLARCIESICNQTYRNLQIILVDDGSTDGSGRICDAYAAHDPRVQVIHKENGGVVSARKAGLEYAQGIYIGLVDGDDYLEPEMYTELSRIICRENVDFVHSGYYIDEKPGIYGTGKDAVFQCCEDTTACLRKFVLNPVSDLRITPSNWSKLYRSELVKEAYLEVPNEVSYGEDLLFLCNCLLKCRSFSISSKAHYHYVTRMSSACHRKSISNIEKEVVLRNALCRLFQKQKILNELQNDLDKFYLFSVTACIKHLGNESCSIYQYPTMDDLAEKKIILYGAGEVGQDYYTQLRRDMRCEVLAITDTCYENYHFPYMNLISPGKISQYAYDVIVIAVLHEENAAAISKGLLARGIDEHKILWKKPRLVI